LSISQEPALFILLQKDNVILQNHKEALRKNRKRQGRQTGDPVQILRPVELWKIFGVAGPPQAGCRCGRSD